VARSSDPNGFARALFSGLPGRYDLLAEVLSLGQNRRWRRAAIDEVVAAEPATVLDVATGTAALALQIVARSDAQVVGVDLTERMLRQGAATVARNGASERVVLVVGRGEGLPFPNGAFDALTFTYLLRYVADPAGALSELSRVVKPGGRVASVEFHVPPNRFWWGWWWLYTRAVLPVAGFLAGGGAWFRVGRFLGPSISDHYRRYPLDWTIDAWRRAGFVDVGSRMMSLGGGLVMWGTKAGE
jgi:demethylmenaquinone methyltransferase/2-methoxy-6-polyprenyl-1,4-benzoquinol methylase